MDYEPACVQVSYELASQSRVLLEELMVA